MTAKLRAPGWYRAGLFVVLGVLFAAVIVTGIREAYGFSTPFDGSRGWDVNWQDAVLTFNGRSWTVRSYELRGSPNGEDQGEVRFLLKALE